MLFLRSGLFVRDEKTQLLQLKISSVYDFQASSLACVAVTLGSSLCSQRGHMAWGECPGALAAAGEGHQSGCAATQLQSQPESSTPL